ncbi:MAG: HAD-IB family hydrolase [Clostridia bacterium]|nr:HAD-IB family hydrolase [Clostridia bacterium]
MKDETRRAAFFDFDGTLIPGDSIVAFLQFARRRGVLPLWEWAGTAVHAFLGKIGAEGMDRVKTRALRFEQKLPCAERERLCREFAEEKLIPLLFPEGKRTWDALKKEGRVMVLVSASTRDYMKYVSAALGADELICTVVSAGGAVGPNCRGAEKEKRVLKWLEGLPGDARPEMAASDAYGDSAGDVFMLRMCGRAHAVNPRRKLKREAEEKGWEILRWKRST